MTKSYKRYIDTLVAKFQTYFLIPNWTIEIEYATLGADEDEGIIFASCHADPSYYRCVLNLCPALEDTYNKGNTKRVVEIVCHEFVHIINRQMWDVAWEAAAGVSKDFARCIHEQQTQHLSRIILQSLPKSFYKV